MNTEITKRVASLGVTLAALLLLAACGSSGGPGVASLGRATPTPSGLPAGSSKGQVALAFSQCMRHHGVTNFPDPSTGGGLTINSDSGINPDSPVFQAAQTACKSLLPNGGQIDPAQAAAAQAAALRFSQCMRDHGVASFPDPQFSSGGGGGVRLQLPQGVDFNSPQFQAAQNACQSNLPKPPGGSTVTNGGGGGPVTSGGGK